MSGTAGIEKNANDPDLSLSLLSSPEKNRICSSILVLVLVHRVFQIKRSYTQECLFEVKS